MNVDGGSLMYCPKCGQQQVSDNTRFCSQCGLPISGLAEWIAAGGILAVREEEAAPMVLASPRRKGITRGAKLMFLSGVLLPIFFGLSIFDGSPALLLVPLTIFLAGLSLMLYSRIFGEEIPPAKRLQAQPSGLGATLGSSALPPASNIWINNVGGQQVKTAELAQPPSVTEHTTQFLRRDQNK